MNDASKPLGCGPVDHRQQILSEIEELLGETVARVPTANARKFATWLAAQRDSLKQLQRPTQRSRRHWAKEYERWLAILEQVVDMLTKRVNSVSDSVVVDDLRYGAATALAELHTCLNPSGVFRD